MRSGIGTYILIIVLVLLLFGLISIGDILSVAMYIILGIVVLAIVGAIYFRYKINKIRRQMEEQGASYSSYSWGRGGASGSSRTSKREEGEITIQKTTVSETKVVRNEVGDYVEYEDIEVTEENKEEK